LKDVKELDYGGFGRIRKEVRAKAEDALARKTKSNRPHNYQRAKLSTFTEGIFGASEPSTGNHM
jgi:hypothetical protein